MAAVPKATNEFTRDMSSTPREVLVRFGRFPFVHPMPTVMRIKYATDASYTAASSGLTSWISGGPPPLKTRKATEDIAGAQAFYTRVEAGVMPCESLQSLVVCIC